MLGVPGVIVVGVGGTAPLPEPFPPRVAATVAPAAAAPATARIVRSFAEMPPAATALATEFV
jgi:hypothetical protein